MVVVVDGKAPDAKIDGRTPNGIVVIGSDDLSGVESLTARWKGGSATADGCTARAEAAGERDAVEVTVRDRAGERGPRRRRGARRPGAAGADRDRARPSRSAPARAITINAPGARLLVDGRKAGAGVQVATGRRHVVEAVDKAGNRSRVTILVPARPTDRAA